jgi:hypothetical protein
MKTFKLTLETTLFVIYPLVVLVVVMLSLL